MAIQDYNTAAPRIGKTAPGTKKTGIINSAMRKQIPSSQFGLPAQRKYPMPDKNHAINAKARATQQVKAGNLSSGQAVQIRAKANQVLVGAHVRRKPKKSK